MDKVNFIDIGAAGFLEPPWKEKHINHLIRVDPFGELKGKGIGKCFTYRCCIHEEEGDFPFYVTKKEFCSSMLKPNFKFIEEHKDKDTRKKYKIKKTLQVPCRRLDSILDEHDEQFHVLKVDTQGSDLSVIRSCGTYLEKFLCIHVEAYFEPMYEGSPLIEDIDSFLRGHNFTLAYTIRDRVKAEEFNDFVYLSCVEDDRIDQIKRLYTKHLKRKRKQNG